MCIVVVPHTIECQESSKVPGRWHIPVVTQTPSRFWLCLPFESKGVVDTSTIIKEINPFLNIEDLEPVIEPVPEQVNAK